MRSVLLSQTACIKNIPYFLKAIFQIAIFFLTFHVSVGVLILQEGQSARLQKSRGNSLLFDIVRLRVLLIQQHKSIYTFDHFP